MKFPALRPSAVGLLVLFSIFAGAVRAEVLHVGPGQTYTDIASAITAANDYDVIEIDEGTYTLTAQLSVTKPISLIGAGPDKTFVDGNKTVKCLKLNNAEAIVASLSIQNGYIKSTGAGDRGVGVYIDTKGGTVSNCVITANRKESRVYGCAGVFMNSTAAVLTHCTVTENENFYNGNVSDDKPFGTGVWVAKGKVLDCTITDNTANLMYAKGGGVYLGSADAYVARTLISGNALTYDNAASASMKGAGVYVVDGVLEDCLIVDNSMNATTRTLLKGGGLYQEGGTVINCTIADNTAYAAGGAYVAGGTFVNNIVCGNAANANDTMPDYFFADEATGSNLCLPAYAAATGVAVQFADSVFARPGEDPFLADYTIDPGSPCYDKGKDGVCSQETDFFGAERVQGEHIDIGASEATPVSGLTISFEISAAEAYSTEPVTFTGSAYGPGVTDENTTFVWTDENGTELGRGKVLTVCLDPGTRSVTMTVTSGEETKSETKADCIKVTDGHVYVENGATPTVPYNTPATAFTNLDAAVAYAQDGMAVFVGEGVFLVPATITVDKRVRIIGSGVDKTVLDGGYRPAAGKVSAVAGCKLMFNLNNIGAELSALVVSNACSGSQNGAGVYIGTLGGTVSNCWVRNCSIAGGNTGYGAGIYMAGNQGVVTHSRIFENSLPNAAAHNGVGICMSGGLVKDSLIVDNTSAANGTGIVGGGIYASGGRIVNCTVAGNYAFTAGGIALAAGAKAVNCIVYGNETHGTVAIPDYNVEASNRFENCCFPAYAVDTDLAKASPGMVFVSSEPYAADYTLEAGSPCEDAGADGYCTDSRDLFGAVRVQGGAIDIGCAEATPSAEMVINFAATPVSAIGSADVTLTAFVSGGGAKPDLCTCEWTVGGESFSGRTVERTFEVGRYDVTLKVTSQTGDVKELAVEQAFVIYPTEVRVETSANPAWPWDTAANAFTNLAEALEECVDGMTIRVGAGSYPVSERITVSKAVNIIGAGMYRTTFYRSISGRMQVLALDNANAYVAELAITNGSMATGVYGSGVTFSSNNGGTMEHCLIAGCEGLVAAYVCGARSYLRRSIIRGNRCTGVKLTENGHCESCLIAENTAEYGAGVLMTENSLGGGYLRNCTVIGNHGTSTAGAYSGAGVYCGLTTGSPAKRYVYNCLIAGNTLASEVEDPPPGYPDIQSDPKVMTVDHCYAATEIGEDCVFGVDPRVRANGKIAFGSPCCRKGVYQGWMEGQLDLFGNPRTDESQGVDIGCCQSRPTGMMLLVR